MRRCNGCDGIVGVDCFNPSECEWIAHQQERSHQGARDSEIRELRARVAELERRVVSDIERSI